MSEQSPLQPPKKRERSFDFLRGSAIIFMVLTHVIVLFYNGDSEFLEFWGWWGGTVCFTTFLFVFSSVFGVKIARGKIRNKHELLRALKLLIGYYIIALWVEYWRSPYLRFEANFELGDFLTFGLLPEYTEFILAFIWFTCLIVLLKRIWAWLAHQPILLITIAALIYYIGKHLSTLDWGNAGIIKSQLVGGYANLHTFPVFAYFPIFALGLIWGNYINQEKPNQNHWSVFAASLFLISLLIMNTFDLSSMERWPPDVRFIMHGVAYSLTIVAVFWLVEKVKLFTEVVAFIGQHPFEYYLLHLLILLPWFRLGGESSPDEIRTWFVFAATMSLIAIVILFKKHFMQRPQIPPHTLTF